MKKQKLKSIGRTSLAGLMAVVTVLSVPTLGSAHTVRKDSWTMQLPAATAELSSPMLTEEGQNIRVNTISNSYQIEIPILNQQDENWVITVTSRSPEHLSATLAMADDYTIKGLSEITYYPVEDDPLIKNQEKSHDGNQLVYLNLNVLSRDNSPKEEVSTQQPEQEGEGENQQPQTPTENGSEVSQESSLSLYENSPAEGEPSQDENTSTEEPPAAETPSEGTSGSSSTTETRVPETAYVWVKLIYGMKKDEDGEYDKRTGKTISATLYIPIKPSDSEVMNGTLKNCPSQYNPEAAIPLLTGDKGCELMLNQADNKEFPPMTRYTIGEGKPWLLYDGGTIQVPAKTNFTVDLSLTELNPNRKTNEETGEEADGQLNLFESSTHKVEQNTKLEIKAGTNTHNLEYMEIPTAAINCAPFVMKDKEVVLEVPYQWGSITPVAGVEQLTLQDGKIEWKPVEDLFRIKAAETENKITVARTGAAQAGTYQITLSWIENGMTLYELQTVFYVQYGNAG